MSAHHVHDVAPLGSLIKYGDHSPRPPSRFTKKVATWQRRNGVGRLVRKEPQRQRSTYTSPASITLHEGDFASDGVILVTVMRTHPVDSELHFEIVERPKTGMVRILQPIGDDIELLHLAQSREAAELWLAKNKFHNARLEDVVADEIGGVQERAALPQPV
jgi:hypothetical protein